MSTATLEAPAAVTAAPTVPARHTRGPGLARGVGRLVRRSAAVVLFLLLWEYGTQYLLDPARKVFLPPLHVVLQAWWGLVESGQLRVRLALGKSDAHRGPRKVSERRRSAELCGVMIMPPSPCRRAGS